MSVSAYSLSLTFTHFLSVVAFDPGWFILFNSLPTVLEKSTCNGRKEGKREGATSRSHMNRINPDREGTNERTTSYGLRLCPLLFAILTFFHVSTINKKKSGEGRGRHTERERRSMIFLNIDLLQLYYNFLIHPSLHSSQSVRCVDVGDDNDD